MQLTSAQKRYLKQLAHHLKPLMQIGKDGVSPPFVKQLLEQLDAHELIKLRVLNNCESTREEIEAPLLAADVALIQKVGHVYTVFKQRPRDSQIRLP